MKILNLYAGIGGNRKLWGDEHEITAVEINEQIAKVYTDYFPNDTLIIGDAHNYLLEHYDEFDFIWSSPPCQSHSKMVKATRHDISKYPDMKLYQEIIFLKHFFKGRWVVENVTPYYDPLVIPTAKQGRHLFWSNFAIPSLPKINFPNFIQADNTEDIKRFKKWLGIEYEGNIYLNGNHSPGQVLRNCVHPETGLHILNRAMDIIEDSKVNQATLF
jgi:DNA (cytosine-5)-methyltransferase 1